MNKSNLEFENKLKEKETEISVLKEMLKSSNTMLRMKDSELERLKKIALHTSIDATATLNLSKITETPMRRKPINIDFYNYKSISTPRNAASLTRPTKKSSVSYSMQDRAAFIKKLSLEKSPEKRSPRQTIEHQNSDERGSPGQEVSFLTQTPQERNEENAKNEDITLRFLNEPSFAKETENNEIKVKPKKPANIFDPNGDSDLTAANIVFKNNIFLSF
jgi:hypothetical protein